MAKQQTIVADATLSSDCTVVALDIGGTIIKAARVDALGRQLAARTAATGQGDIALQRVLEVCATLCDASTVAVGLAVCGLVDPVHGLVRYAANLRWTDLPLATLVSERISLPVAIVRDVAATTRAEIELGLGRSVDDLVVVAIGTGIGAGIIANGQVIAGATSSSGELGHMVVRPGGEPCACGQRGCLEVYASAAGIARRYAAGTGETLSAEHIAQSTEPRARAIWNKATITLAQALVAVIATLDPALIVLAGGLSQAGDRLVLPVVDHLSTMFTWRTPPPVRASTLAASGGLVGTALVDWEQAGRVALTQDDSISARQRPH